MSSRRMTGCFLRKAAEEPAEDAPALSQDQGHAGPSTSGGSSDPWPRKEERYKSAAHGSNWWWDHYEGKWVHGHPGRR